MNWIIRNSKKLRWQTDLTELLKPIYDQIDRYSWIITDLDYISHSNLPLPINLDQDYFILSAEQFKQIVDKDIQIIWGVILGVPNNIVITVDESKLPFAEFNGSVWKNGNIQHPEASIEIVCFDSGYTIVKFTDSQLSEKFKNYFDEAIELEKFNNESAPNY